MRRSAIVAISLAALMQPQVAGAAEEAGKALFEQVCAHCHNTNYDAKFGPGLAGILERRDETWVDAFLQNPAEMIRTDEYAKTLRESNRYDITMPALPEMQDSQLRASVINYLKTLN